MTLPRIALLAAAFAAAPAFADDAKPLFDGSSPAGWILTDGKPLPEKFIQDGAINPHGTGSYIVSYKEKLGDFVVDFDYKLSKGCNSGVFIRVNDLKDPVYTGIEIALDDTKGTGMHDTGAFYDLVPPKVNAQKPAGEWNHMTITAKGAHIKVEINGKEVSTINLDEWNEPGKRPDGSNHKFEKVAIGKLDREGYLGFQDHGQDCWYKNITFKKP
ncbi:DUF1080 domain-containing protein [Paludisphaera sp.]|uniref:3-keto-disaccharide hydrolase n=1 Tax=Paludisphaera sp. TaxID=2017432 RepID=UPI00301B721D